MVLLNSILIQVSGAALRFNDLKHLESARMNDSDRINFCADLTVVANSFLPQKMDDDEEALYLGQGVALRADGRQNIITNCITQHNLKVKLQVSAVVEFNFTEGSATTQPDDFTVTVLGIEGSNGWVIAADTNLDRDVKGLFSDVKMGYELCFYSSLKRKERSEDPEPADYPEYEPSSDQPAYTKFANNRSHKRKRK